jgi:hypothetical protein
MAQVFTPYSTISPYFGSAKPSWVPVLDQERIASYQTYEEIYWNHPETFALVARGAENQAIYVPNARTIVDAADRFTANGLGFAVTPGIGTPADIVDAQLAFDTLFKRERFFSTFQAQKLFGIIRGDQVWHITADELKLPGERLSLRTVDPASYFPVFDDDNLDRILKIHLAEQFVDPQGNKVFVRRQTYERDDAGLIVSTLAVFEVKDWELETSRPVRIISGPTTLPPEITAFPVYHIKNFEEPGNPYGSSEIRGFERIMAAVNQSVSDEDIALALEGLGIYTTDSGQPVDDEGNPVAWILGPGRVLENAGDFKRVNGVGSVTPYGDHIDRMVRFLREASATGDSTIGKVNVQVAESGIALAMDMMPALAKAKKKDTSINDVLAQMFYGIQRWMKVFEQMDVTACEVLPTFGEKLPVNRAALIKDLSTLVSTEPPIMSAQTAREILAKNGVQFAPDEAERIAAQMDAASARAVTELAGAGLGGSNGSGG